MEMAVVASSGRLELGARPLLCRHHAKPGIVAGRLGMGVTAVVIALEKAGARVVIVGKS